MSDITTTRIRESALADEVLAAAPDTGTGLRIPLDTLALIEHGRQLVVFDPTRWPRALYEQQLDVSIHKAVHRWLATEARRG